MVIIITLDVLLYLKMVWKSVMILIMWAPAGPSLRPRLQPAGLLKFQGLPVVAASFKQTQAGSCARASVLSLARGYEC